MAGFLAAFLSLPAALADAPPLLPQQSSAPKSPRQAIETLSAQIDSGTLSGDKLARAYIARATFEGLLKNYEAATADFTAAEKLLPDNGDIHIVRDYFLERMGRSAEADAEYDRGVALSLDPIPLLSQRAERRFSAGHWADAIADYNAILARKPDDVERISDRGDAELELRRYDDALADYASALKLDPSHTASKYAFLNRVFPLFAEGRYQEAAAVALECADADPTDAYSLLWLHYARARAGIPDDFASRAAKIDRGKWPWPIIAFYLGTMRAEQVDAAAAAGGETAGQICEAAFHRGEAKLIAGDYAGAAPMMVDARKICPPGFNEYGAAQFEMDWLAKRK